MSEHSDALARVRERGDVVRIERDGGFVYIDAETDPETAIVETYTAHIRDDADRELPYAYHIDGLELYKTLENVEYRVVPKADVEPLDR